MNSKLQDVQKLLRLSKKSFLIDPNTTLIKLRQSLELFIEYLLQQNGMIKPKELFESIEILGKNNIIDNETLTLFHRVRIFGNKAAHEMYAGVEETRNLLSDFYEYLNTFTLELNRINIVSDSEDNSSISIEGKCFEEMLAEGLIIILKQNSLSPSNYTVSLQREDEYKSLDYNVVQFSFPMEISSHKDYEFFISIYNGYIEILSSPIVENIMQFERHMFINLINFMNSKPSRYSMFIHDDNIYAKSILYYEEHQQLLELVFDTVHSSAYLGRHIREFLEILMLKKRS